VAEDCALGWYCSTGICYTLCICSFLHLF